MQIEIYQIPIEQHYVFRNYSKIANDIGFENVVYEKVWEGVIPDGSLEYIFETFNVNHPDDYEARSLSTSDIVKVSGSKEIEDGSYFCDNIGWKKVKFDGTTELPEEDIELEDITDEDDNVEYEEPKEELIADDEFE